MANKIQLRRDIATNWMSVNPILSEGELGVELDSNRLKCGDGVTPWNDLDFITDASPVMLSDIHITKSYSIPEGKNAGSFGPVTVDDGATVTVPAGSTWTVL